ncbi:DUF4138 domain-containing protein [Flagellimonas lutimaris]|uniref:DUF4138 domain-containing protein n=1 Tax=Flagellimonas lutimaris TaxID=475082 RepID=A0A3A1NC38_9FLAO|nr:DUF4138 domain-containing protein [Allomuricauda lutimaris]RIV37530.1 DUF4138 domain-containing protein [Allomuricauda lutimaris]
MKLVQYLPVLFFSTTVAYGQSDTLYVNDTHVLSLIFPKPISRAVTGHANYTLGYNQETPERVGLLQGNQGDDSNLLVVTEDGLAYSYYLVYRKQFKESHRFVAIIEAVGNVLPEKPKDEMAQKEKRGSLIDRMSDSLQYRKASQYFLERNTTVLKAQRKDGMILRLRGVSYFGKETYIVLEIENRSDIDFEVDFVQLFRAHGNSRKKSSYQKLILEPLYSYKGPSMVKVGAVKRFVYVVPKFTLTGKERLMIEIHEKRDNRKLMLNGKRNHARIWDSNTSWESKRPNSILEPNVFTRH